MLQVMVKYTYKITRLYIGKISYKSSAYMIFIFLVLQEIENRISGEHLGPTDMRMGSGEGSIMRNFIVCTVHLMIKS